jgi:acyl-CoA dehydrogenase
MTRPLPIVGRAEVTSLLERVAAIGHDVVAVHAEAVDADARFPAESFAALREERLLSAYVPEELGGLGLPLREIVAICEVLGRYCGSTAMIFAMHQIQVACLVHHGMGSPWFRGYLGDVVKDQLLIASATTELGVGGDVRTSRCALEEDGANFVLEKQAPVISYGEAADAILATCRRSSAALPSDQVQVLVRKQDATLTPLCGWDTLGFRGTCSLGFTMRARGSREQVLPAPYRIIHGRTMHPFAHSVWSALWLGIAADAVNRARASVRAEARKTPGALPPTALRLAEVDAQLFSMRAGVHQTVGEYETLLAERPDSDLTEDFGFASRINNLKIRTSQILVDVVGHAMSICGIAGYRNDSPSSLGRHLRDAYGAALMVSNDRILGQSASMQIMRREE